MYTKGPWQVIHRGADCNWAINITPVGNSKAIANVIDFGCETQVNQYIDKNPEQEANARLIAQAPALLEALKEMLDAYAPFAQRTVDQEGESALHSAARNARAAIAKAEGREQ